MILTLWATFLILSIILLSLGYTFYQASISDILIIVGWTFIFALGVILLSNAVEYKTGVTETINNNYVEYAYVVDGVNHTDIILNNSIITSSTDYEAFNTEGTGVLAKVANSHLWGFLLMLTGLMGAILFWFDVKAYGKSLEEESLYEESK